MSTSRRNSNLFRLVTKKKLRGIIDYINIHDELFRRESIASKLKQNFVTEEVVKSLKINLLKDNT